MRRWVLPILTGLLLILAAFLVRGPLTVLFDECAFAVGGTAPCHNKGEPDTSDWKTHTSAACGYTFLYPKEWLVEESGNKMTLNSPETKKGEGSSRGVPGWKDDATIECYTTLEDFVSANGYSKLYQSLKTKDLQSLAQAVVDDPATDVKLMDDNRPIDSVLPIVLNLDFEKGDSHSPQAWMTHDGIKKISYPGARVHWEIGYILHHGELKWAR